MVRVGQFEGLKEILEGGFKPASQTTVAPGGEVETRDLQGDSEGLGRLTGPQGFGTNLFANFKSHVGASRIDPSEGVDDPVLKHSKGLDLVAGAFDLLRDLAHLKTSGKS